MEKYQIIGEIGRGAFGLVKKAQNKETKEIVAIKQMLQEYESWDECINLRELKCLRKLSHVNIIKLKEVFRVKKQLSFVFEYIDRNIYKLYESAKQEGVTSLPENTIKSIVYQISSALAYMHKHGFFHRDLKPENLLISQEGVLKLIDFGLAREIRSRPPYTDYVSTRWYRAPEILMRSTNYNSPVDIFALGCIMAELYLMKPLFNGSSEIDQLQKITSVLGTPSKQDWPDGYILASQKYYTFPSYPAIPLSQVIQNCPPDAINLITEMLRWDPQKRITVNKILQHPYFNNVELPEELNTEVISQQTSNNNEVPVSSFQTNVNQAQNKDIHTRMNVQTNLGVANQNNKFNHNYSQSNPRQLSPQSHSQYNKNHFQNHYQSSSPDIRYNQNQRSQTDLIGNQKFEVIQMSQKQQQFGNNPQNSKKNLDPIYEFLNNDVRSLNNPITIGNGGNNSSLNYNNNSISILGNNQTPVEKGSRFSIPQGIHSKNQIDEDMEEIEQEIINTYIPSGSTLQRTRVQTNSNNNNMFGQNQEIFQSSSMRNRNNQEGYVPTVMARNTQNIVDIYKFDPPPKPQLNTNKVNNNNNNNNNDIYNFDNIMPMNNRKNQIPQ